MLYQDQGVDGCPILDWSLLSSRGKEIRLDLKMEEIFIALTLAKARRRLLLCPYFRGMKQAWVTRWDLT